MRFYKLPFLELLFTQMRTPAKQIALTKDFPFASLQMALHSKEVSAASQSRSVKPTLSILLVPITWVSWTQYHQSPVVPLPLIVLLLTSNRLKTKLSAFTKT